MIREQADTVGFVCLACGAELPEPLRWTASLRCHDCRELNAPLRVEPEGWRRLPDAA